MTNLINRRAIAAVYAGRLYEREWENNCEQKITRETVGHISSAGCKGQKEVVTLAHNGVFRDVMFDIARHQKKTIATVREYTPACWQPKPLSENWARLVLKLSIFTNRRFRKRILRTCPILKIAKICPSIDDGQQVLHHAHDISIMDIPMSLADNTNSVAVRSLHHANSIVHMYTNRVSIQRPPSGAVVDT